MDITYYKRYEPIFGSWHIVREIGEGNFGKVFEIERRDFGRIYKAALKVITVPKNQSELKNAMLEFDDDPQSVTDYFRGFVEEMVDEFALMSRLKGNSNIVSYEDHAVFEHDDGFGWDILIRMELLTPMLDYMHTEQFGAEKIIKLGTDMCKALEHCGKLNIIHRDIKPENIFVSEFGDFKLGDFGVARVAEETMGNMSRKGTYNYMAPEVYKGEPYGADVDTYSLGLMLFRLLNNNRAPFLPEPPAPIKMTDREAALTRRMKGEAIPAPVNADVGLSAIILKACAYNPKDRYASPAEMREALENLGTETAISAFVQKSEVMNISEAETVYGGEEAETDRTVSVFGVAKEIKAAENKPKAEETTVAEDVAEAENVQDIKDTDSTVAVFRVAETKNATETVKNSAIVQEQMKESAEAEVKENKQPDYGRIATQKAATQKSKSKLGVRIGLVAILALAIILLMIKFCNVSPYSPALEETGVEQTNPVDNTKPYITAVCAGSCHTVALRTDGSVIAIGADDYGQCDVGDWSDIIAISTDSIHTVGLRADGSVVAVGNNDWGECDVSDWNDIVAISAGSYHTAGLRSDGTVVAVGRSGCSVSDWNDIVAISAGCGYTLGLQSDGTVVATGNNDYGQCNVSDWNDIIAISAGPYHAVGIKSDGTVVATGDNSCGQLDVTDWTGIVAVSAGTNHTAGLKKDGTVVAIGDNAFAQCDIFDWRDIVEISAAQNTIGLHSDGSVVIVGSNFDGQSDASKLR